MTPVHVLGEPTPPKKRGTRAGHQRERDYAARLRDQGWFVMRSPASKGVADLIAIRRSGFKDYCRVRFYEIKSNHGSPYMNFRAKDRAELIAAAEAAGATPVLVHWPPRKQPVEIPASEWPQEKAA